MTSDNSQFVSPVIVQQIEECIKLQKSISVQTAFFDMYGTPLQIIDSDQPYATVRIQYRNQTQSINNSRTTNNVVHKRVGFQFRESLFYLRDVVALSFDKSLVLDFKYHENLEAQDMLSPMPETEVSEVKSSDVEVYGMLEGGDDSDDLLGDFPNEFD